MLLLPVVTLMLPPPMRPAPYPHPGHLAYPESPLESARKCLVWGWSLVGGGCLLALIPFFGILVWFIAPPLVVTGFVLAIVSIAKGRTVGGLCLLLFSMFVAPFTLILGPILSSLLGVAATDPLSPPPDLPKSLEFIRLVFSSHHRGRDGQRARGD